MLPAIHFDFRTIHPLKKPDHKKFIAVQIIEIYFWTMIDGYLQQN